MSKVALAKALRVTSRIVTAWEAGEKAPRRNLQALVEVLRFPESFFYGEESLDEPSPDSVSFRALASLTAGRRDQALVAGALAWRFSDWIGRLFTLPNPDIPTYNSLDPETAAMAVRAEWGLGELPIRNMIHLLELHGVRVFSMVEDCRAMDAYSLWRDNGIPYVFLNTMKSAEHSRQDAAHELGHLVLHRKGGPRGKDAEQQANRFGSAFLMTKGSVLAGAPYGGTLGQIVKAKHTWNVSVVSLIHRMHVVNLLTDWQYRSLMIEASEKRYRLKEPEPAPREISQVLAKVLRALRDERLTLNDVAAELEIVPSELKSMVFGLTLTSVTGASAMGSGGHGTTTPTLRLV